MTLRILHTRPPNYMELVACGQFDIGEGTIFTYGAALYVPSGGEIDEALMAHETVHSGSQLAQGVEVWWQRYIEERQFRFEEEFIAHQAEWAVAKGFPTRPERRRRLKEIVERISGPLYGRMVTEARARRLIVDACK